MNELRFALRQLLKNPGFAAVAVLTLALGIGATASVFSLIHGVLLTPPPYRKPEQIVLLTPERIDVMPPGIRFLPSPSDAAEPNYDVNALVDYWSPPGLALESKERSWNVIGRLRDGVTLRQAQAELTAIAARQAQADPDLKGITVKAHPLG